MTDRDKGVEKVFPNRKNPRSKGAKGENQGFVEEMSSSLVQLSWRALLRDKGMIILWEVLGGHYAGLSSLRAMEKALLSYKINIMQKGKNARKSVLALAII